MENGKLNAYPVVLQHGLSHDCHVEVGLNKREYISTKAMQGILAHCDTDTLKGQQVAICAVKIADELLKQLYEPALPEVPKLDDVFPSESTIILSELRRVMKKIKSEFPTWRDNLIFREIEIIANQDLPF